MSFWYSIPAVSYLSQVSNRKSRTMCEICSELTVKTSKRCQLYRFGVFIVNFEQISHIVLVFALLILNK